MESLIVANRATCLPFPNEEHYRGCMENGEAFRQFISTSYGKHPEFFLHEIENGFTLHGFTAPSKKHEGFRIRRLKLNGGETHQIRPSFMMPYMIGRTEDVEKALFLCRFGVPFEALSYVFGRDPMYWYRAYISLGRISIVGSTVRIPDRLPERGCGC